MTRDGTHGHTTRGVHPRAGGGCPALPVASQVPARYSAHIPAPAPHLLSAPSAAAALAATKSPAPTHTDGYGLGHGSGGTRGTERSAFRLGPSPLSHCQKPPPWALSPTTATSPCVPHPRHRLSLPPALHPALYLHPLGCPILACPGQWVAEEPKGGRRGDQSSRLGSEPQRCPNLHIGWSRTQNSRHTHLLESSITRLGRALFPPPMGNSLVLGLSTYETEALRGESGMWG